MLLAERVQGVEVIGPRAGGQAPAGFRFELLALSTNAHLQLKDLMGQPVRLDLLTQQSRIDLRPFHGHVTAFALLGSDGGLARYKLTVEPWLAFLGHRQDAWVFQDQTVMQIVDEVFADYQGQGRLAPTWRWDLADPAAYPRRSLCVQYHETDLAFVQRLLAEEGLFCWFEHSAAEGDALGAHTLVIADHNGSFQPNLQPVVRYTQSGSASFREDSLSRFDEVRRVAANSLAAASWDHRSVQQRSAQSGGDARLSAEGLALALRDQPGAYAYEDSRQAQRIVQRQLEALQATAHQCQGQGPWRQATCATTFQVAEHPSVPAATRWVTLAVQHRARNNLTADLGTSLRDLLGALPPAFAMAADTDDGAGTATSPRAPKPSLFKGPANQTDEPLYKAVLLTQDAAVPVRAPSGRRDQGDIVFTRPQVPGVQTAIVVGLGEPVHTDRDNRIKVQFHWQRGSSSAHRLSHAAGSNAPGDQGAGTWVRVSQAWSGANWGGHFTPRLGQEVLVSFIEGDIDRPVVVGSAYNGQGSADAPGNQVAAGAATATGDAGPWFPGALKAGELEGHQHTQVLAGFKSQSLEASQRGNGGYNQLVFDDTPAQARTVLGTTTAATWLQLGHLLQQNDNQRLAKRGHGLDLATAGHGALRAGSGLHLTGYARVRGSDSRGQLAEARAAIEQLEQASQLTQAWTETAQKHNARLTGEAEPADMPVRKAWAASLESLNATDTRSNGEPGAAGDDAGARSSAAASPGSLREAMPQRAPVAMNPLAAGAAPSRAAGLASGAMSAGSSAGSGAGSLVDKARSAVAGVASLASGAALTGLASTVAGAALGSAGGLPGIGSLAGLVGGGGPTGVAGILGAASAVTGIGTLGAAGAVVGAMGGAGGIGAALGAAMSAATGAVKLPALATGLGDAVDKLAGASPFLQGQLSQLGADKWQFDYGALGAGSFTDLGALPPTFTLDGALKGQVGASVQALAFEAGRATFGDMPAFGAEGLGALAGLSDPGAALLSNVHVQREILSATGVDIGLGGDGAQHAAAHAAYDAMFGGASGTPTVAGLPSAVGGDHPVTPT